MPNETGRELDAAIAREVMGHEPHLQQHGPFAQWKIGDGVMMPHYSTDANAARLVIEQIERRELVRAFMPALRYSHMPVWSVAELLSFDAAECWSMLRHASPEAICRAALKAVEGSKG